MCLKLIVMVTLVVLLVQTARYADAPNCPIQVDSFTMLQQDNLSFAIPPEPDSGAQPSAANIPLPKGESEREKMGEASYAVYLLATRIGQRIEQKFEDIKSLYSPKVEAVSMGDLVFNVSLSYGWDFSHKKLNATITFDEIKKRRR